MNDLYKKLKSIMLDAPEECEVTHTLSKQDIELIKQAFKEAGYIHAKRMVEVAELLTQQAKIIKNLSLIHI